MYMYVSGLQIDLLHVGLVGISTTVVPSSWTALALALAMEKVGFGQYTCIECA